MKVLGCVLTLVLALGIIIGIDALIALFIDWALNSFTQIHPTYMTVFVVLVIISLFFGGTKAAVKKS